MRTENAGAVESVREAESVQKAKSVQKVESAQKTESVRLPAALAKPLLRWYRANARDLPWRHTRDPYRIWVSEIMLQQTRVAAVLGYYARFLKAFPTVEALAVAPEEDLLSLWQGLGYYSRARNLHRTAREIVARGGFPETYREILLLPGVGTYTAGAIASAAFGERVPAVDGNLLRVIARLTDCHRDTRSPAVSRAFREAVAEIFPTVREDVLIFNQSLMELGAVVCVPNGPPRCDVCPVSGLCAGCARGTADQLPVRGEKKPRRIEERTVFILLRRDSRIRADGGSGVESESGTDSGSTADGGSSADRKSGIESGSGTDSQSCVDGGGKTLTALRKRPGWGLLAGLWEFPNVSSTLDEAAAAETVSRWGLRVLEWHRRLTAKHIFTHVEWHMSGYVLTVEPVKEETPTGTEGTAGGAFQWVDRGDLNRYAIPSAFARFREQAAEMLCNADPERGEEAEPDHGRETDPERGEGERLDR